MKATELMIGDWVTLNRVDYQWQWTHHDFTASEFNTLEPIPLTPEILEKNGWIFMEGQDYSTFPVPSKWVKQFVPFALRVDGETYSIANTFAIKYVHELQHALRLCGLEELADNFQIWENEK